MQAELERNDLVERISRLAGSKEVVSVCKDGNKSTFHATTYNI